MIFSNGVSMAADLTLLPRAAIPGAFSLVFLAVCFTNFVLDTPSFRMKRGLKQVRHSPAYVFTCCTTLIVAINSVTLLRETVLQLDMPYSGLAAMLALTNFSLVLMVSASEASAKHAGGCGEH